MEPKRIPRTGLSRPAPAYASRATPKDGAHAIQRPARGCSDSLDERHLVLPVDDEAPQSTPHTDMRTRTNEPPRILAANREQGPECSRGCRRSIADHPPVGGSLRVVKSPRSDVLPAVLGESAPPILAARPAAPMTAKHAQSEPHQCPDQRHHESKQPKRPGEAPEQEVEPDILGVLIMKTSRSPTPVSAAIAPPPSPGPCPSAAPLRLSQDSVEP